MKVIQSLLAVSILAVAGTASAATVATYTASSTTTISGATTGSGSASGTATLDDSGVLTLLLNGTTVTGFTNTTNGSTATFNGSYSAGTFTAASGQSLITSCTNNGGLIDGCSSPAFAGVGGITTFITTSGSVNLTSGSINITATSNGASVNSTYTVSNGVAAVPVPAAAWLFGSGLLGLAGTARRRRNSEAV